MAQALAATADVEKVQRMARQLDDALSRDLLTRYLREIEYDFVYRAHDDRRPVVI